MFELATESTPILMGLIVLSMALVRLIERLIDRLVERKNGKKSITPANAGGCRGLTPEEHAALMRLDEMHAKFDPDGTPLWYMPRSWASMLKDIAETQDRIAVRLRDVVKAQEMIVKRMDRWEDSTGRVEVPIRRRV
jgi:hypothetical protein